MNEAKRRFSEQPLCAWSVWEDGIWQSSGGEDWRARGPSHDPTVSRIVAREIARVRQLGLRAAWRSTRRFDAPELRFREMLVTREELAQAEVADDGLMAIRTAIARVRKFHEAQLAALTRGWERDPAGWCWRMAAVDGEGDEGQRWVPLRRVGLYVPGGEANYPSSVIMTAVPAQVAGVRDLTVACPPRRDGSLSPAVLVAARELGIERIVKTGGAAAVALMALGDGDRVPAVDKVVGPGNRYVNEAKRQLWGAVGLDMYAGPSEVAVVADETANPDWAAVDWLTQVEHAADNQGFLLATTVSVAQAVVAAAERWLRGQPREATMREALQRAGRVFVAPSREALCAMVNELAPEHLTLMVAEPEAYLPLIENAGCILLGAYTPQSAGDFCAGPSHTLPTARAARFASPVNVLDFLKVQSVSRLTPRGLGALAPTISTFGDLEGFPMHGLGAAVRQVRVEAE